jgi:hypothetical protein
MAYYQGDYYRGDYYQGFPFLAALPLLGKLAKKVIPKAAGKLGALIGRKGPILKKAGGVVAAGAGFELGARAVRGRGRGDEMEGVRRRRMNVANVKALRRAIRRAHGFAKLSRKVLTFPISKPPRGRPLFKKAGRRR